MKIRRTAELFITTVFSTCIALVEEPPPAIALSLAARPAEEAGASALEPDHWRMRARNISIGARRADVERLLPVYLGLLPTAGRLALSNGLSISIPSPPPAPRDYVTRLPFRNGWTIGAPREVHLDYQPRMAVQSGSHLIEQYSVARNIVVYVNYGWKGTADGHAAESPDGRVLSPVTVERRAYVETFASLPTENPFARPFHFDPSSLQPFLQADARQDNRIGHAFKVGDILPNYVQEVFLTEPALRAKIASFQNDELTHSIDARFSVLKWQ